jgi:hypothetical protein
MRRAVWLILAVVINAIIATVSQAQTNSWIHSSDGKWEKAHHWDDGSPSDAQSAVIISNANSKVVTIDRHTARNFPDSLTISNLSVSAPSGSTNTLFLGNTGTIALHILNDLTIGIDPGDPFDAGGSDLISTNSTLIVDGVLGGQLLDDGTMVITGGSLITTNCSLQVASFFDPAGGLLIISNAVAQARDVIVTSSGFFSARIEVIGGTMTLSSFLTVGNGFMGFESSLLVSDGAVLVVTNNATSIAVGDQSDGAMIVSNATFLAADIFLAVGPKCFGGLTINNGTISLSGELGIGCGEQASGSVSLDGGMLAVTNGETHIGLGIPSGGAMAVSDGLFLARDVYVGADESEDILFINGGISILSSNLQIGVGFSEATVSITGGQLFVTNAPIVVEEEAQCVVSGGQLAARTIELGSFNDGTLMVDGGTVTVSEGITLGDCNESFDVGYASVDGGQLIITNAAGAGFIDVRDGELTLEGGTLQVDKLVMTNSCGSFLHTGGTLIVGSVVLDPNAFRVTSVTREGNNLRVTWLMGPGQTNALQAAAGGGHGNCTMDGFTDIFVVTNNATPGTLTNYLDIGAATNIPSRFYRARLSP